MGKGTRASSFNFISDARDVETIRDSLCISQDLEFFCEFPGKASISDIPRQKSSPRKATKFWASVFFVFDSSTRLDVHLAGLVVDDAAR